MGALAITWFLHDAAEVHGPNDPAYYWRMANGHVALAPLGYRILVPSVVRVLPLDHHVGFVIVTGVSLGIAAGGLGAWLERRTCRSRVMCGVALVAASGPVWWVLRSPYRPDSAMLALFAVAALLSDDRRWLMFACVAALAVAARDVSVIMGVVPLLSWWRERDARALVAFAVTVGSFVAVRGLVPVVARGFQHPAVIFAFRAREDGSIAMAVVLAICISFGAAWLFVPLAWRRLDEMARLWGVVALASVPTLLIAGDWSRLLAPAFLLVAAAAVASNRETIRIAVVAGLLLVSSYVSSPGVTLVTTAIGVVVVLTGGGRSSTSAVRADTVDADG